MTHRGVGSAGGVRQEPPAVLIPHLSHINTTPGSQSHLPFPANAPNQYLSLQSAQIFLISTFVLFLSRPIFVLIPHLSYINTGLLVLATGATAPNQYLRSGHRYSQANSSPDIFTVANRESPQSHRNAVHKYSDPPESNMDLDLSKSLISL